MARCIARTARVRRAPPSALVGIAAALLSVLATASPVAAQGDAEQAARLHFESGRAHYENGAYEQALTEFEAAYELSGRAELLYNLYLTVERLGDLSRAATYLESYLRDGQPEPSRRGQLERRLANLRERGAGGGELAPAAIAFGLAGAGLVAFGVFGGLALAEDEAIASGCGASGVCSDPELADLSLYTLAADISWVAAAVAGATGLALLLTLGLGSDASGGDAFSLAPWASPSSAGLSAAVRY